MEEKKAALVEEGKTPERYNIVREIRKRKEREENSRLIEEDKEEQIMPANRYDPSKNYSQIRRRERGEADGPNALSRFNDDEDEGGGIINSGNRRLGNLYAE